MQCVKFLGVTSDVTWSAAWGVRILIKKQITESVSKPRDEFIKHNESITRTCITVALYYRIID